MPATKVKDSNALLVISLIFMAFIILVAFGVVIPTVKRAEVSAMRSCMYSLLDKVAMQLNRLDNYQFTDIREWDRALKEIVPQINRSGNLDCFKYKRADGGVFDSWGNELKFSIKDNERGVELFVISLGPDKEFGSDDDLVISKILRTEKGVGTEKGD